MAILEVLGPVPSRKMVPLPRRGLSRGSHKTLYSRTPVMLKTKACFVLFRAHLSIGPMVDHKLVFPYMKKQLRSRLILGARLDSVSALSPLSLPENGSKLITQSLEDFEKRLSGGFGETTDARSCAYTTIYNYRSIYTPESLNPYPTIPFADMSFKCTSDRGLSVLALPQL